MRLLLESPQAMPSIKAGTPQNHRMPNAVSLLRTKRLARSAKPFLARGGFKRERCAGCRLVPSHCMCVLRPSVRTRAGVCLLMADIEPLKPSNTGWLIADMVADTFAFGWARTAADPALLTLLSDPQWQPYLVFPGEYAAPGRVVHTVQRPDAPGAETDMRPLFILLDGTWAEARKMFGRSPYLDGLPVLSLQPDQISQYKLRRSRRDDHFCTSEVAALCLNLAGEHVAEQTLAAYLDVFTHHYLQAKNQLPIAWEGAAHQRLREVSILLPPRAAVEARQGERTVPPISRSAADDDRLNAAGALLPLRSEGPVPQCRRS
jgi:DTW domain-containing protein YfiP